MLYTHISVTNIHEEDEEPSEKFLVEVRNYFKQQKTKNPANRDTRHTSDGELQAYVTLCV